MFEIPGKIRTAFLLFIAGFALLAAGSSSAGLDKSRYIGIDEIRPGMKGYCLTTFGRAGIEKFDLDVLSVVRNIRPGKNAILIQSTDERFIHTGPVAGCSGSPVYIDGRMAGALSFGWPFSKDPVYGVTPIEEMLSIGMDEEKAGSVKTGGYLIDYTAPIDFSKIGRQIAEGLSMRSTNQNSTPYLPCPLVIGGLPQEAREQVNSLVKPFGLIAVAGSSQSNNRSSEKLELVPGASLAVPLLSGDMTMTVIGTVTERTDEKVYALGHGFLGYGHGQIDLPMATAEIHAVVSSLFFSFKIASMVEVVGALTTDESSGIRGRIGAKASSIPLTIKVDRYNDPQRRVYNCQVVDHRLLTPVLVQAAVAGASFMLG
ncbi:MAG: SpoIVB peptidase S55 domain-containing protein, partial [Planctomycetota bacterium]